MIDVVDVTGNRNDFALGHRSINYLQFAGGLIDVVESQCMSWMCQEIQMISLWGIGELFSIFLETEKSTNTFCGYMYIGCIHF